MYQALLFDLDGTLTASGEGITKSIQYALRKMGYEPGRILMVGDAPGDRDAAEKNGVRFYPILVGHEGESWKRLLEEAFPKLLAGSFDAEYQKELNQAFERNLGVHADSE